MNEYLLTINAIACVATAFRLMAYRRNGATHRPMVTVFAWSMPVFPFHGCGYWIAPILNKVEDKMK
ncbi:Protein of uncharacterised function (DUF754) [Serratia fonticola]|uniref:phage holin family protein n=1 Tax=Serratia fonticola TaxID=47917 RepID=UPI00217C4E8B|nr:phage holin family protein [Serratia fonticola]CAI1875118.1 Protein of uncharacterised function (DUF754) [Serratia fonticola]